MRVNRLAKTCGAGFQPAGAKACGAGFQPAGEGAGILPRQAGSLRHNFPRPRGSLLVFAVAVLAVLAMLSVAFLVMVRQAIASSRSGLSANQNDLAAEAGNRRVLGYLASNAGTFKTLVFDRSTQQSVVIEPSAPNSPLFVGTPNSFWFDTSFDTANSIKTPTFATLSSYYQDANFLGAPHFSLAPMRIASTPPDRAAGYFVRTGLTEFFAASTDNSRRTLPAVGTIRGRHFVWYRDLDANLYAVPRLWGIDTGDQANDQAVRLAILEYLRNTPSSDMTQTFTAADMQKIEALDKNTALTNMGDLAVQFVSKENDPAYPFFRADLDTYFSPTPDIAKDTSGNLQVDLHGNFVPQYKTHPAAVNINTAPEEVIQAILSQIPFANGQTFAQYVPASGTAKMSELIAKRIVAKRPFLSRIDFEDFVASLLPGDPADPATPCGSVHFAMTKRIDGELRLSQWMEIPLLPKDDPNYFGKNTTASMIQRFDYFLDDTDTTHYMPSRAQCGLTVRAFNNMLNSLSSSSAVKVQTKPGDSGVIVKMLPGEVGTAGSVVIDGNGTTVAESTKNLDGIKLGGDDVIVNGKIMAGPNGIAETEVSGFSYYSHDYVPIEYKPYRLKHTFDAQKAQNPAYVGKFVYGDPNTDFAPASSANMNVNYLINDLQQWSCIGDGTLSGYYDMWFNPHDIMLLELGVPSTADIRDPTEVGIKSDIDGPILTGNKGDDIQETAVGGPVNPGDIVVLPGPNGQIETDVNALLPDGQTGDDVKVKAIRLGTFSPNYNTYDPRDNFYPNAVDGNDYVVAAPGQPLYTTPFSDPTDPDPTDADQPVEVIVDGGNGTCETSASDDVRQDNTIQIGDNITLNTIVWGPLRASQRDIDQPFTENVPALDSSGLSHQTPTARIDSGSLNNGDVAWSPQICFRSRFYTTYVLAQGISSQPRIVGTVNTSSDAGTNSGVGFSASVDPSVLQKYLAPGALFAVNSVVPGYTQKQLHVYVIDTVTIAGNTATFTLASPLDVAVNSGDSAAVYSTTVTGERRMESIYDAVNDQTLWQRAPLTDKRALGDP